MTRKGVLFILKRIIAHLAQRPILRTLTIASAERLKSLFPQTKFTRTHCVSTAHVPNENISAIVIPTIRGECTKHCNCSQNVTPFSKKLILVELFDFAVTQDDNVCKIVMMTVIFKLFDGKDESLVFFSNGNDNQICLFKCSTISSCQWLNNSPFAFV